MKMTSRKSGSLISLFLRWGSLQFWRRFVYSLLIILAKIDPGFYMNSQNTTLRCTAMKFSGHRLLNKKGLCQSCHEWPCASVWEIIPIFWHFQLFDHSTDATENLFFFFSRRDYLPGLWTPTWFHLLRQMTEFL